MRGTRLTKPIHRRRGLRPPQVQQRLSNRNSLPFSRRSPRHCRLPFHLPTSLLAQNVLDRASDLMWTRSRTRMSTCPLDKSCESNEEGKNEPSFWNWKRSGGSLRRSGKSTRQRKGSGSRRNGLGRPRRRRLKKKRRRGYTSKKSLLHGSDGRARCSRSAPSRPIPQISNPRPIGGKEATPVRHTTPINDKARMDLPRPPRSRLRGMILPTVCEELRNRSHWLQFRLLPRTPQARMKTLPR